MVDKLYFGDNLKVLREHVAGESVDLINLDPPFNSNATYNVLFKFPDGSQSHAQIEAFDDTWHWTDAAEDACWRVLRGRRLARTRSHPLSLLAAKSRGGGTGAAGGWAPLARARRGPRAKGPLTLKKPRLRRLPGPAISPETPVHGCP